ncbi:MAG: DUF4190 domain-containing protein [Solirubrobacteraceae bacterium]
MSSDAAPHSHSDHDRRTAGPAGGHPREGDGAPGVGPARGAGPRAADGAASAGGSSTPDTQTLSAVNGRATLSLLLALLWLFGIGSVAAMVLGRRAMREIDAAQGRQTGWGVAVAGWLLGLLGLVGTIVLIALMLFGGEDVSSSFEFRIDGP